MSFFRKEPAISCLLIGLGNPGTKYRKNRHNVGFMLVDRLAESWDIELSRKKHGAKIGIGAIGGKRIMLVKPQSFMNLSGKPVAKIARYYLIPVQQVLVAFDDLDLPLGTLRLRPSGGSGGHRGMRSVIHHLGTQDFPRLRLGIGRPPGRMDPADYVLQDFDPEEELLLDQVLARGAACLERFVREGIDAAMTFCNSKTEI